MFLYLYHCALLNFLSTVNNLNSRVDQYRPFRKIFGSECDHVFIQFLYKSQFKESIVTYAHKLNVFFKYFEKELSIERSANRASSVAMENLIILSHPLFS